MKNGKALDIDAIRCFVVVADLGGFTRAAEFLDIAQAAVSLKIKNLETRLSRRLLERTPRNVQLTRHGRDFISAARELLAVHDNALHPKADDPVQRLAIGISDHVVGADLPDALKTLGAFDPTMRLKITIASSYSLIERFDRGEFDAVIVRRESDIRAGRILFQEEVSWFASPSYDRQPGEPLRLATLSRSCGLREIMTQALDDAEIAWEETFVGGGILAVSSAAAAGLAVTALAVRLAPAGTIHIKEKFGLPYLPPSQVAARVRARDQRTKDAIRIFLAAIRKSVATH